MDYHEDTHRPVPVSDNNGDTGTPVSSDIGISGSGSVFYYCHNVPEHRLETIPAKQNKISAGLQ
jgi:hypothetical protein